MALFYMVTCRLWAKNMGGYEPPTLVQIQFYTACLVGPVRTHRAKLLRRLVDILGQGRGRRRLLDVKVDESGQGRGPSGQRRPRHRAGLPRCQACFDPSLDPRFDALL